MASDPDITIVTTAWNAGPFIAETIKSVQDQGLSDWRHIVVDDGSTDDTASIAASVGDERLTLIQQANAGQSAAQNVGLSHVQTEFVVMLDADDRLRPGALARLRAAFEREPDLVLAYGHIWLIDEKGRSTGAERDFQASPARDRLEDMLKRNLIASGGAAMIRTEALKEVGGFDPSLRMSQGWECWARLAAHGPVAELGGEAVLDYRLRAGSVARQGLSDPSRSMPALSLMYSNPKIASRFPPQALKRLRRICEAHLSYMAGHEAMRVRAYRTARRHLFDSLKRNPKQLKGWILFACALSRRIPGPIARRLGTDTG